MKIIPTFNVSSNSSLLFEFGSDDIIHDPVPDYTCLVEGYLLPVKSYHDAQELISKGTVISDTCFIQNNKRYKHTIYQIDWD